ncbi:Uncharacterised protein [BD1-7 clade bacterium]|uniref:Uncharacterized protein n=1 Tax=BD1-7 clade bacterium TaxID=2029982 RepID=A0A5S9NMZ8_9GAMM|nr:Uncharacterised protein [BD1-7 clade bacterium]CAA0094355.1 Uncharacterised protein [BD1-7 clade bacterium]
MFTCGRWKLECAGYDSIMRFYIFCLLLVRDDCVCAHKCMINRCIPVFMRSFYAFFWGIYLKLASGVVAWIDRRASATLSFLYYLYNVLKLFKYFV